MNNIRRCFIFCLVLGLVFMLSLAALGVSTYRDAISGTSFTVPDGWTEQPLSQEREFIQVKYTPDDGELATILFGSADIWGQLTEAEKNGLSRDEYNISLFTKDDIAYTLDVNASDVKSVELGSTSYYRLDLTSEDTSSGITIKYTQSIYTTIQNGYFIQFQYVFSGNDSNRGIFEETVKNASIPNSITSTSATASPQVTNQSQTVNTNEKHGDTSFRFDFGNIFISLLITVLIYSVPIMVYRYGIRKKPVERNKAKRITIAYAFVAFLVMAVILSARGMGAPGGAIVLWSYINYSMLTKGKNKDMSSAFPNIDDSGADSTITAEETFEEKSAIPTPTKTNIGATKQNYDDYDSSITTPQKASGKDVQVHLYNEESAKFCHKCGSELIEGSLFCNKCGTKVWTGEK
jgi:hypothetical protein